MFSFGITAENFEVFENDIFVNVRVKGILLFSSFREFVVRFLGRFLGRGVCLWLQRSQGRRVF